MPRLATLTVAVVLLTGGVSLAVVCKGGASHHGNAAHSQYHGKPGCNRGWHKGDRHHPEGRDECPKPPGCDRHGSYDDRHGRDHHRTWGRGHDDCRPDHNGHSRH